MNKIAKRIYSSSLSAKTVAAIAFAFSIALDSPYENAGKVLALMLFAASLPPLVCCILVREALGKGADAEKYRRRCMAFEAAASIPVAFGAMFFYGSRATPPTHSSLDYSQVVTFSFAAGAIVGVIIVYRCLYPYTKLADI